MSIQLMTTVWKMSVPAGQKLVLLALCDNANDQGECYPAIATIATKCSMSERSIFSHISWLEKYNFLYRENRLGRSTIYHIQIDPCKICTPANIAHPPAKSAPTPANIAHPPAKSAPIIITKPSSEPSTNLSSVATATATKKLRKKDWSSEDELQAACRSTWKSYSDTYFARYKVEPIRNAAVNSAIKSFCKKIPHHEAPHVAAFFVAHNDKYYVQKTHQAALMSKDAEGLRTQWATNSTMTSAKATKLERTSSNRDAVNQAIEMTRARNQNAAI